MKITTRRNNMSTTRLAVSIFGLLLLVGRSSTTIDAFTPIAVSSSVSGVGSDHRHRFESSQHSRLYEKNSKDDTDDTEQGLVSRFWNPRIDDPAMPLTEAGLAQIVAPTLQLFWLISLNSPYPMWAQPMYDYTFAPEGAFLAPTLIHGAGLACSWLLGCLASRAYEKPNFRVEDGNYGRIVATTIKAGAFACGILILATQFDLYREFGGYVQVGDSGDADARIYRALVELIDDVFFEFIVLLPWRLFRSNFD